MPAKGYPTRPIDLGTFGLASPAATKAAGAAQAARAAVIDPALAAGVFRFADDAVRAANYSAAAAFWSAVSIDATRVEKEGATAAVIAGSPLWPQHLLGPGPLQSLWQELKVALHAAMQNWQVWTKWYDDRLQPPVSDNANQELAYVLIDEALWEQGPAVVNAEIRRLIEELESPRGVVQLEAFGQAVATGWAGPLNAAPLNTVVLNQATATATAAALPEQEPTATRFGVNSQGLIDVVPDPPAFESLGDISQREVYDETRETINSATSPIRSHDFEKVCPLAARRT
jgi:hypothetical protein